MTQQEEQRKIQNENRRLLSLLKNNQSTKSFEKLKNWIKEIILERTGKEFIPS